MARLKAFGTSSHTTAYISVRDFLEGRSVSVDVDGDEQFLSMLRYVSKVNPNTLIITTACSSCVISSMYDSLSDFGGKTNQLGFLFSGIKSDDRRIKVHISTTTPSQANDNTIGARRKLGHVIFLHSESGFVRQNSFTDQSLV